MDIASKEPVELFAGDTVKWRRSDLSDYPASASWQLKYYFRGPSQPADITATADGDAFSVTLPATTTKDWNEGLYWWGARVSKAGDEYTVDTGAVLVKMNFADPKQVFDGRTHVKKTLDNLEATIERLSAQDLSQYSMAARTAVRQRLEELVPLRQQYAAMYAQEQNAAMGKSTGGTIQIRFT